ncbi:hypothetical protein RUM43_000770 [Polyplax serrata]|uniref:Uncharacterized protein n=1 Tax=Polyplax serrata TaxID=468196 RepID=A0AAN8SCV2_POLSC
MASYRVVLLLVVAVALDRTALADDEQKAKCECGVFKSTPEAQNTTKDQPLASKAPNFDLKCDESGKGNCANMCKALAEASREEGPKKLCELVENTKEPFVPRIYYRACDDESWTFTGLEPTVKVCCANKAVIPCA